MKKILVITSSIDVTASYIIDFSQTEFFRLDVDKLLNYKISVTNDGWSISNKTEIIYNTDIQSIYYRKPMLPDLSTYYSQYHNLIRRDIIAVINGIADSFSGVVLSRPSILRQSENKICQLLYASTHGFKLPESYIGNSNEILKQYLGKTSIIKPISTGKTNGEFGWELYQTSMLFPADFDISQTPVYIQKYIPKQYEVRMTIVGKHIYPIRINTANTVDWRADYENHKYEVIECPAAVKNKCFQMLSDFRLQFGAFDFIVTPENEWLFLEINPNGQWLWLERALGLDISKRIIELLGANL